MANFITRLIPSANYIQRHPVYNVDIRRLRVKRTLATLQTYTIKRFLFIAIPIILLWLLAFFTIDDDYYYSRQDKGFDIILYLFFASLAMGILLDFASIVASINIINRDKITNNWDLVCLTSISHGSIITAKHIITQIRVWRMTTVVVTLRIAVVFLFIVLVGFIPNYYDRTLPILDLFDAFIEQPFEVTWGLVLFGLIIATYIFEPVWRMQAVTSFGIMVSSRIQGTISSMLAGFGSIVFMWITQSLTILFLIWVITLFAETNPTSEIGAMFITTLFVGLAAATIFFYYRAMTHSALRLAKRFAFRTP